MPERVTFWQIEDTSFILLPLRGPILRRVRGLEVCRQNVLPVKGDLALWFGVRTTWLSVRGVRTTKRAALTPQAQSGLRWGSLPNLPQSQSGSWRKWSLRT